MSEAGREPTTEQLLNAAMLACGMGSAVESPLLEVFRKGYITLPLE